MPKPIIPNFTQDLRQEPLKFPKFTRPPENVVRHSSGKPKNKSKVDSSFRSGQQYLDTEGMMDDNSFGTATWTEIRDTVTGPVKFSMAATRTRIPGKRTKIIIEKGRELNQINQPTGEFFVTLYDEKTGKAIEQTSADDNKDGAETLSRVMFDENHHALTLLRVRVNHAPFPFFNTLKVKSKPCSITIL